MGGGSSVRRVVIALGVGLLAIPASAGATTTLAYNGATLQVTGDNARQDLRLSRLSGPEQVVVADVEPGGTITAPAPCTGSGSAQVACPVAHAPDPDVTSVNVQLAGADDGLMVNTAAPTLLLPVTADGGSGADVLTGGAAADTLRGGSENDLIDGGPGIVADTLEGGTQRDTIDYAARSDSVTVSLGDSTPDGASGENDVTSSFEGVRGGSVGDTLSSVITSVQEPLGAVFDGNGGADTITGGPAGDTLRGGTGTDTLDGAGSADQVRGNEDNDIVRGGGQFDALFGGTGADTLEGGEGNDTLDGEGGPDVLDGGPGGDLATYHLRGAKVSVTIGTGGANDGETGEGDEVLASTESARGSGYNDVLIGNAAPNSLIGEGGHDEMRGLEGDDYLRGMNGADVVDGGPGRDTAKMDGYATDGVTVSLDGVANDGARGDIPDSGGGPGDNVTVEVLQGSGGVQDNFTGSDADEEFIGSTVHVIIDAGGGDDILRGYLGSDVLNGDGGNDVIYTLHDCSWDNRNDTATGGPGDDILFAGCDGTGGDMLDGGTGTDTIEMYGGEGAGPGYKFKQDGVANDGGPGFATDDYRGFERILGTSGDDTIDGTDSTDLIEGKGGADTINGFGGADTIIGGSGADTIDAGADDDLLIGSTGKDVLKGGDGFDTTSYDSAANAVTVTLDGTANDGEPAEQDNVQTEGVFGSEFSDTLTGGAAGDLLDGADGADTIDGAAGDDVLDGGLGSDQLTSGPGADTLRARDGVADTLLCDTRTGKSVTADAGIDTVDTCAAPETAAGGVVLPDLPNGAGAPRDLQPLDPVTLPGPTAPLPIGRTADKLAAALKLTGRLTVRSSGAGLRVATFKCAAGAACAVSAELRLGKKVVGKVTVPGSAPVMVHLTKAGARTFAKRKKLTLNAKVTAIEGASRATATRKLTIVLRKARR